MGAINVSGTNLCMFDPGGEFGKELAKEGDAASLDFAFIVDIALSLVAEPSSTMFSKLCFNVSFCEFCITEPVLVKEFCKSSKSFFICSKVSFS